MNRDTFDKIVTNQLSLSELLLTSKGHEYAEKAEAGTEVDRLEHFKKAAVLQGETPEQATFGMLAKHLVSIADMVGTRKTYPQEAWDEKIRQYQLPADSTGGSCGREVRMNEIEVKVLNPESVPFCEKMMVCVARLTQRGHRIKNMADFMALYEKPYSEKTVASMTGLPHPTIQKFAVINIAVVGASRRFLAQVTRHQNEVKFMSASLQYSNYSDEAAFAIPYEILARSEENIFLATCEQAMENYTASVKQGLHNDAAGYMAPQALRNVLVISATPYQWRHMIGQRTCRRNTSETRIVFLKIWQALYQINPKFFARMTTGPFCMRDACQEGRMGCGSTMPVLEPAELLALDYPLLT